MPFKKGHIAYKNSGQWNRGEAHPHYGLIPWNKGLHSEKTYEAAKKAWKTRRINGTDYVYNAFKQHGFKSGFKEDLGHSVRSEWEANFERWLRLYNIDYEYEGYKISFEDGTYYIPDYFLPLLNLFVEVHPTNLMFNKQVKLDKAIKELEKDSNHYDLYIVNTESYNFILRELQNASMER